MMAQNGIRHRILILFVGVCVPLVVGGRVLGEEPRWQMGDFWKIGVTLYSRGWAANYGDPTVEAQKNIPTVLSRYIVEARITGIEEADGTRCWKVEYVPDIDAPSGIRQQRYVTWVSQDDGSIRRVRRTAAQAIKAGDIPLDWVGNIAVVPAETYGFPLELIRPGTRNASDPNREGERSRLSVSVTEETEDNTTKVGLALKRGIEEFKLKQVWPQGAKWWGRYVKHYQGHIEIEAAVLGPWLSGEFTRLYLEWQQLNDQGAFELAQMKCAQMKSLGIAATPYLIERIRGGDLALIPAAAELSGGRLGSDATQAETLEWWETNKEKWLAPFPPHEPDESEDGSVGRRRS